MSFWSKERLLRSALSPCHALVMVVLVSLAGLAAHPAMGVSDRRWLGCIMASSAIGCMALAAYIDFVCLLLPDPLLLLAAIAAEASAVSSSPDRAIRALATGLVAVCLASGLASASLGRGDAKLCGVVALWLGEPGAAAAAVLGGVAGAGAYALAMAFSGILVPRSVLPLGPWIVGSAWCVWLAGLGG